MKLCVVAFCLILLAAALWVGLSTSESTEEGGKPEGGKPGKGRPPAGGGGGAKGCVAQPLPSAEVSLCRNLEVVYPELGSISCKVVPVCNKFREKITMWPAPRVKFPSAVEVSGLG
ncbi:phosphatidylethanolamine-binding protein 4 [Acomys russatus]|uniref:phosphatidylethanolamine-binding protein 4 n=1 Tax=Acomys russatus TaxID=60746 RepID=UPI0021E330FA|nr:phosphatidylethanolamine-binding protein 4 [Acomys russatus]